MPAIAHVSLAMLLLAARPAAAPAGARVWGKFNGPDCNQAPRPHPGDIGGMAGNRAEGGSIRTVTGNGFGSRADSPDALLFLRRLAPDFATGAPALGCCPLPARLKRIVLIDTASVDAEGRRRRVGHFDLTGIADPQDKARLGTVAARDLTGRFTFPFFTVANVTGVDDTRVLPPGFSWRWTTNCRSPRAIGWTPRRTTRSPCFRSLRSAPRAEAIARSGGAGDARAAMAFTLRQLQYFVAVAEHGSVSHAAQSLSISQSAVTEAVKDLEADLGVKLFDRHARGLAITHKGHAFLRHATAILAEVSGARAALEADREALTGTLHLGVTSLMAGYVMSDLLARFRRANPAVDVSAIEDSGEYLEHLLIGGELDVAVMVTSGLRERGSLQVELLSVSPYRLWMPLGHRLTAQESISVADLAGETLIVLRADEMEEEAVNILASLGARPRVAFRTRSVEAVRSLVATGAGVALLPDLVYRPWSLEGDRIESRDVSGALPVVQVGMVWRRGSPLSPPARDFIALAQASQGR